MTAPATYEERTCFRCLRGKVYRPATIHGGRGEWVPCGECGGKGTRQTYIYPTRRGRR